MNKITEIAWAITAFEGFLNGSASANNKNQGNIRYSTIAIQGGATAESPAGFARFPTYEQGFQFLVQFLTEVCDGHNTAYQPSMTIADFFKTYAPASDDNNPNAYALFVCNHTGIPLSDTLSSLIS